MKPTIINKNSKFVVITYYWGTNNKNKNLQLPCPEDLKEGEKLEKEPITYGEMIKNFKENCKQVNVNYMFVEYPEFAVPGGYQKAINYKAQFILEALEACKPRSVVYIDGDMKINKYPIIFDMPDVDYMAQGWNMDFRTYEDDVCYDPYVFETSGGIMYFGNTKRAKTLLKLWNKKAKELPGKADDRIISQLFNNNKLLLELRTIQLPIEYLWFTMDYPTELKKKNWNPNTVIIEHPACLTGEDRAGSLGGDVSRIPPRYDYDVTDLVTCTSRRKDYFWEYVFFPNKKYVNGLEKFLQVLNRHYIDLVKYDKKYSPKNNIVKNNMKLIEELPFTPVKGNIEPIIITNELDVEKSIKYSKKLLIPTILAFLLSNQPVIYAPPGIFKKSINRLLTYTSKDYDFMARNDNKSIIRYKKDYYLKLNKNYLIYFKPTKIVIDLVKMSKNLTELEKNFNSSFIFISRLSCKWI